METRPNLKVVIIVLTLIWLLLMVGRQGGELSLKAGPVPSMGEGQAIELVFAVYAEITPIEVMKKVGAFREYLQQGLRARGIPAEIRMRIFTSYGVAIEALSRGEVDFVRFGPVSYVVAKGSNPGIRLLAMESNNGAKSFNGVIAVPEASPLKKLEDLRGKHLAFGARLSTTGRYLPQAAMVKAGILAKDLDGYTYLDRHDKVAFAVAAGQYDAGAMNEETYEKFAATKGLRAIFKFPCVTKPWVARAGLDERIATALSEVLLEAKDPRVLEPINRSGFLPAEEADYSLIREAMSRAASFDTQSLVFGIYTTEPTPAVYAKVRPVLDQIEKNLSLEGAPERILLRVFPNYWDAITALAQGEVDFGRLGAASYVQVLKLNKDVRVLVNEVNDAPRIGVFIVQEESNIKDLAGLKGRTLAFGDQLSSSGRFLAQRELVQAGIKARDLRDYAYLGRHDLVAEAVGSGKYDAGVLSEALLDAYRVGHKLRVVHSFPIPPKAWVARPGEDGEFLQALTEAIQKIEDAEVLGGLGIRRFVPVEESAYDVVRDSLEKAREFERVP